MKNGIKVVLLCAILFNISAISAVAVMDTQKTTCYTFKNSQLTQKFNCDVSGSFGVFPMSANYYEEKTDYDFTATGLTKTNVAILESFPYGRKSAKYRKTTATLNGKKASMTYRDSSFKPIQKPKNSAQFLTCLEVGKTTNEFCYLKK